MEPESVEAIIVIGRLFFIGMVTLTLLSLLARMRQVEDRLERLERLYFTLLREGQEPESEVDQS